ncbi:uncharacterized protein [Ptychodera flava]|uniref:uncharacterized protein n=1 Tax=Ptychodera flava TaxID=63121 RepID=UPI00396A4781
MWHIDGYDKLTPYGICINGCIDGFSRLLVWLEAYTTNKDPTIISSYFVEAVKTRKGCPRRIRADMGTENRYIEQMQIFMRGYHTDALAGHKSFIYGRSTGNQRIEHWWSILRKQNAQFWINLFENIRDDGLFDGSFLDKSLIQFCFLNFVQADLDEVSSIWNTHRIRSSRNQNAPSGRPILLYSLPELYGADNQLRRVDMQAIQCCEEECVPKGEYPCDVTIFDLCCTIMEESDWDKPSDPYEAATLYALLRSSIRADL